MQSELRELKQKILDEESVITTTFFSINTLLHYCRIFSPNNSAHYKRNAVKFIINETFNEKYLGKLLENQKDTKNTLITKKKIALELFEDRTISKPTGVS